MFELQIQICLSREEYVQKRTPYFLRFSGDPPLHVKVKSFRYTRDCVLEVSFMHEQADLSSDMRAPAVCFHPEDDGFIGLQGNSSLFSDYSGKYAKSASVRNELDRYFPDMRVQSMALVCDEVLVIVRLMRGLVVAIPSQDGSHPFRWEWENVQAERPADGFRVAFPSVAEGMRRSWYRVPTDPVCFSDGAKSIALFADMIMGKRRVVPGVHFQSCEALVRSDMIRAQLRHLRQVYPDLRVSNFSRTSDSVVAYIDRQWLCKAVIRSDGTWTIECGEPDPIVALQETAAYLEHMRTNADNFLSMCAHFFRTGRVCAACSLVACKKMRRCPCGGAYYCGRECQKGHWPLHKAQCGTAK